MSLELSKEALDMSKEAFEHLLKLPSEKGFKGWEVPLADAKKKAKENAKTKAQKKALEEGSDDKLSVFLAEQYAKHEGKIYPKKDDLFNAFKLTPYDDVKVVILGQDPYFNAGEAHGLSFSVPETVPPVPIPASLRNIFTELDKYFTELENDSKKHKKPELVFERPSHGDLTAWAQQEGVLLINAALSVRHMEKNSHKTKWKYFTDAVISAVNEKTEPVVFVLWGLDAQEKRTLITKPHHVLIAPHPASPRDFGKNAQDKRDDLAKKKNPDLAEYDVSLEFSDSKPFSKINEFLRVDDLKREHKRGEIVWQLK